MPQYKKKNGIPDRWTDYQAVGKRIPGTRFVAFKVPLKQSLRNRLTASEAFGPHDLLQALEGEEQQLGLIIDLTFTTRYYMPEDLPESVYYIKIFTAGHEVPSDPTILSFKRAVRRFLKDNEDNDKLIGVHCTHGLNRTGYLVCRYLIDVDGVKPEEAIELFNTARGHHIERDNYIADLQKGPKRSNEGMEEADQEPTQGGSRQRPPNQPFSQSQSQSQSQNQGQARHHPPHRNQGQARHHPPHRNQRPWPRDHEVPYEDTFGAPPDWGLSQRCNGGPGLLPPPPGLFAEPPPPPFMRLPHRPRPSEWDRRGPPPPCPPPYPILPRYRFGGPQEDPPGAHHYDHRHDHHRHDHHHHHHHQQQEQQYPQGPHRKSRERPRPRPHKHAYRDPRT